MPHFMQFSVAACELCMLHCVLLDCNCTKWTGNALSIPAAACSQQLLRRNKLPTGSYFFACLVFSPHHMNVFVTDFILDNLVTHVHGFSSGILMILFDKLCVKCEGIWINIWLPCTVNMQNVVARHCVKFVLQYTFYLTHFTDFKLKKQVLKQRTLLHVLPYKFYTFYRTRSTIHVFTHFRQQLEL